MARGRSLRSVSLRPTARQLRLVGADVVLERLQELKVSFEAADPEAVNALMTAARFVRDEARDLVRVRTGLLQSAIYASEGRPERHPAGPSVVAGVSLKRAPHAHFIEFGTARAPAYPFFRPAARAVRPMLAQIIKELVAKKLAMATRE